MCHARSIFEYFCDQKKIMTFVAVNVRIARAFHLIKLQITFELMALPRAFGTNGTCYNAPDRQTNLH